MLNCEIAKSEETLKSEEEREIPVPNSALFYFNKERKDQLFSQIQPGSAQEAFDILMKAFEKLKTDEPREMDRYNELSLTDQQRYRI